MLKVIFSRHAISQMFDRGISVDDIEKTITHGEVIERIQMTSPIQVALCCIS